MQSKPIVVVVVVVVAVGTTIRGSCCRNVASAHLSASRRWREFDGSNLSLATALFPRAASRDPVIRKMREPLIANSRSFCNVARTSRAELLIENYVASREGERLGVNNNYTRNAATTRSQSCYCDLLQFTKITL